MSATKEPSGETVLQIINHFTPMVLETMAGLTAITGEGNIAAPMAFDFNGIAGSVSLSGHACGVVYTAFPNELAKMIAGKIFGGPVSDQDVSDVVSELTNMIAGNFKSQLCDLGFNCTLSIPSVVIGDQINIATMTATVSVRNEYIVEGCQAPLVVQTFAFFD
ncbi:chemotaxis protein CheX [bacterium]|jgi:chemotaxis protein CheX|nr:chemotaxis protein CheX [bacterium]NBS51922.1 chemotaxis protein CheX [Spartobacteria bacterium]